MIKIIFMGGGDFALPTLELLLKMSICKVVAIYSSSIKDGGVGGKKNRIPDIARENSINVIDIKKFDVASSLEFASFDADLVIVVSYGIILPKEIIKMPKYGCVNLHPSRLPSWRGASPIQNTIINQDTLTAVMLIKMTESLDAGDIIDAYYRPLEGGETYSDLIRDFASAGAELVEGFLKSVTNNENYNLFHLALPQIGRVTYASKIDKNQALINWGDSADKIIAKIKGLSGFEAAFFKYKAQEVKIFNAEVVENSDLERDRLNYRKFCGIGGLVATKKMHIYSGDGKLILPLILQRVGKKILPAKEFLLGFALTPGDFVE